MDAVFGRTAASYECCTTTILAMSTHIEQCMMWSSYRHTATWYCSQLDKSIIHSTATSLISRGWNDSTR
jgi:hypothetical protein